MRALQVMYHYCDCPQLLPTCKATTYRTRRSRSKRRRSSGRSSPRETRPRRAACTGQHGICFLSRRSRPGTHRHCSPQRPSPSSSDHINGYVSKSSARTQGASSQAPNPRPPAAAAVTAWAASRCRSPCHDGHNNRARQRQPLPRQRCRHAKQPTGSPRRWKTSAGGWEPIPKQLRKSSPLRYSYRGADPATPKRP